MGSDWVLRKSLKAEQDWFLDRRERRSKSENRAGFDDLWLATNHRGGDEGVRPLGRRAQAREGEAGSPDRIGATVGRGKAKLFPFRVVAGAKPACFRGTQLEP
jgi:hypothetical protein